MFDFANFCSRLTAGSRGCDNKRLKILQEVLAEFEEDNGVEVEINALVAREIEKRFSRKMLSSAGKSDDRT